MCVDLFSMHVNGYGQVGRCFYCFLVEKKSLYLNDWVSLDITVLEVLIWHTLFFSLFGIELPAQYSRQTMP